MRIPSPQRQIPGGGSCKLTKSRFIRGLQCPKALYQSVYHPEMEDIPPPSSQLAFTYGNDVDEVARMQFKDGVLIKPDHFQTAQAVEETRKAIQDGARVIFQATFLADDMLARVDILQRLPGDTWKLIEVKAATEPKPHHLRDLAFQYFVLSKTGLALSSASLMLLNRNCNSPEQRNLFTVTDKTSELIPYLKSIPALIDEQRQLLSKPETPNVVIGPQCSDPHECTFRKQCWSHIPEHSVFELYQFPIVEKFELYRNGSAEIKSLSESDARFSEKQKKQIRTVRDRKPDIDFVGIKKILNQLRHPFYFLDFETLGPAIPRFRGMRPYEHFPFQFSCHKLDSDGSLEHFEFLWTEPSDPRPSIARKLIEVLETCGTIVAHSAQFEKSVIESLAGLNRRYGRALRSLIPRFWDLKCLFPNYYYHPNFHGSMSLKKILPALVPELSYDTLPIGEGSEAQLAYLHLLRTPIDSIERKTVTADLLRYCGQDTLGMVKIIQHIKALVDDSD